ncbi:1-acylglycerol-3-phosphate O-acyltransferase [Neisseria arctica]|uniref:1-acylglycerol-3-phosphate O-acyltransferase n=1 Tax=Neisseria arctica TaxID=1470200 RepID=UPI00064A6C25|nr:1-acylglycerol-3-phosphate O-acyltransferase [Neisseria arctica]UOO87175.1 1-acylglycerol-3-phosphate O-acyltransferase [Neisseria arctica]
MSKQKAPLTKRITRLCRMACWLFRTGRDLRNVKSDDAAGREQVLIRLGSGALTAMDIRLEIGAPPRMLQGTGALVAANHISWLDIFAISAVYPSSFIAKKEISGWPILGKMGRNAGTVFINRDSRRDIEPAKQAVNDALRHGLNVSFFPEARTSLGIDVLPFKAALFQAAIDSNVPIQSIALRYYDHTGQRTTTASYAGKTNLFRSLWRIVSMPGLCIRIDFDAPLMPEQYPGADRFQLKEISENFVRSKVMTDSPVAHTHTDTSPQQTNPIKF